MRGKRNSNMTAASACVQVCGISGKMVCKRTSGISAGETEEYLPHKKDAPNSPMRETINTAHTNLKDAAALKRFMSAISILQFWPCGKLLRIIGFPVLFKRNICRINKHPGKEALSVRPWSDPYTGCGDRLPHVYKGIKILYHAAACLSNSLFEIQVLKRHNEPSTH